MIGVMIGGCLVRLLISALILDAIAGDLHFRSVLRSRGVLCSVVRARSYILGFRISLWPCVFPRRAGVVANCDDERRAVAFNVIWNLGLGVEHYPNDI